jgi:hypothetical protein
MAQRPHHARSRPAGWAARARRSNRPRPHRARRGVVSGYTAGQAAEQFATLITQRGQAIASLAIVARWYPLAALMLLVKHIVSFNVSGEHVHDVTVVMNGRTEQLRRAYYLRGLGLSSRIAKETRIFALADWLVDRYRASSLVVLNEIWAKRHEGWLTAALMTGLILLVETLTLGRVASDAIGGSLPVGRHRRDRRAGHALPRAPEPLRRLRLGHADRWASDGLRG